MPRHRFDEIDTSMSVITATCMFNLDTKARGSKKVTPVFNGVGENCMCRAFFFKTPKQFHKHGITPFRDLRPLGIIIRYVHAVANLEMGLTR